MADTSSRLLIHQVSKIHEDGIQKRNDNTNKPSCKVVAVKWFSSIFIALLFLTCLTHSKISLLVLSGAMHAQNHHALDINARSRLFVMLQIISLAPHVINFVRGVWCGILRKDRKWPKPHVTLIMTVMSIIESFGLCLFIFIIPGLSKTHHVILLMNCVFILPLLDNIRCLIVNRKQQSNNQSPRNRNGMKEYVEYVMYAGALISEIVGIVFTFILLFKHIPKSKMWIAPIGVICLSIAWIPSLQKYMVERINPISNESPYSPNGDVEPGPSTSQPGIQNENETSSNHIRPLDKVESTAWKMTALMSFVKLLSTFGFSMLIYFNNSLSQFPDGPDKADINRYIDGWRTIQDWSQAQIYYFSAHITSGFIGYIVGYIACTTCSQQIGFSFPLAAATPLSVILLAVRKSCDVIVLLPDTEEKLDCTINDDRGIIIIATIGLVLAQVLSTWWILYRSQLIVMLREYQLFWTPMYNSALLEHWIMLNRRNELIDTGNIRLKPFENAKRSTVFICTTMFREDELEMKQLLESLRSVNDRVSQSRGLRFEFHIFFDGALKAGIPTEHLLQLVVLVGEVFNIGVHSSTKTITPYGMSLSWRLPSGGRDGTCLTVHLKDNSKVKSKKRWSQVMYMSYVLEQGIQNENANYDKEEESYILTTDADVKFSPKSVEALLDLMTLDKSVGAVCARTHPLGSGLLVWYQIFEYAIGHWFQKASEHVIGSVLCAPGCFSVYRCKAIKTILSVYASNVEKAEEFLTKDMGEDRWFCTLMVQSGWRIEYCAAAENSTHCPENFDEFFKQRRRWIVSTLANQWLLIREWHYIKQHNLRVSFFYKIYQIILLVSTLIGPSSVILVVSGGLKYGQDWNPTATVSLQVVISVCYAFTCLFTSQTVQLMSGKIICGIYAIMMMIAIVGTAVEIATDINGQPGAEVNFISEDIRISSTSLYLLGMAALFLVTALLHLGEFWSIFYGFVYLLGLPSGYLILMIYSICNITDSSWGTREAEQSIVRPEGKSWHDKFLAVFKYICTCCLSRRMQDNTQTIHETGSKGTEDTSNSNNSKSDGNSDETSSSKLPTGVTEDGKGPDLRKSFRGQTQDEDPCVEAWLSDMKAEAKLLKDNGYEKTSFISGLTKRELKDIGIDNKINRGKILMKIKELKDYEIPTEVPENVESWLKRIDLYQYNDNFKRNSVIAQRDLEILVDFNVKDIKELLGITKIGHIKRFLTAIKKLKKPTKAQQKQVNVLKEIKDLTPADPHTTSDMNSYWEALRKGCLIPQSTVFESDEHLKVKLRELRNKWLVVFAMINVLWLILISTLADKGKLLGVFGSNPIGFLVIVVYGLVLLIQFFAMLIHRISTLMHFLGRIPYKCNSNYNSSWMFDDSENSTLDETESKKFQEDKQKAYKTYRPSSERNERTPLLK
ncbi:uncharacterized protein LOC123542823 [Mercenaria mercenaria]|uniref:uncharacterized protein LOC123542823 n=1 Tax=Mercenaria mercenaria TaxID=6596 RepID=UPI00234F321E|nr:uncharacterized protein LOC123542823 [Mercenaria mercenaria]XP_053386951.1 uncharacterized protein LOC123542823 [Mercenaria mercenaria]